MPTTAVKRRNRLLAMLALVAWMGVILFLSSRSSLPGNSPAVSWLGQYQDEVGHLGEYAILGLLSYVFLRSSMARRQAFLVGLAFCVLFSLGDEVFQGMIPNRTPEFKDVLLDAVAATSALTVAALLEPRLRRYLTRSGTPGDREEGSHRPTLSGPGE